jgi:hypothetical protein
MGAIGAGRGWRYAMGGAAAGAVLLLLLHWSPASAADALPLPQGAPILVVSGALAAANQDGKATLDLAFLKSLPQADLTTETPWTEGAAHFEGVRMRDLMARLGAKGSSVTATGTDDYRVAIPMGDFQDYDVVLAYAENGQLLRPEDKGPLWIVYPFSADPQLKKDIYFARSVWQLTGLTVQ